MLFKCAFGLKIILVYLGNHPLTKNRSTHASPLASGQSANTTRDSVSCACLRGLLGLLLHLAPPNDLDIAMVAGSTTSRLSCVKNRQPPWRGDTLTTSQPKSLSIRGPHHLLWLLGLGRSALRRLGKVCSPLTLPRRHE